VYYGDSAAIAIPHCVCLAVDFFVPTSSRRSCQARGTGNPRAEGFARTERGRSVPTSGVTTSLPPSNISGDAVSQARYQVAEEKERIAQRASGCVCGQRYFQRLAYTPVSETTTNQCGFLPTHPALSKEMTEWGIGAVKSAASSAARDASSRPRADTTANTAASGDTSHCLSCFTTGSWSDFLPITCAGSRARHSSYRRL
jgi:hypothetical protein